MKSASILPVLLLMSSTTIVVNAQLGPYDYGTCTAHPDPHFKTWDDTYYDAHGTCCSVMIQSSKLHLHICTELYVGWAGITRAALQIVGSDKLEVQVAAAAAPPDLLFNGVISAPPATVGGNPLTVSGVAGSEEYKVDLGGGQYVKFTHTFGNTLAVEVSGHGSTFGDAEGLCGNWVVGGMIARDGTTAFTPATGNAYEEEWRFDTTLGDPSVLVPVPSDEECDFANPACNKEDCGDCKTLTPQNEACCTCTTLDDTANQACANLQGTPKENCIFDVKTTGDESAAKTIKYTFDPPVTGQCTEKTGTDCQNRGGQCVWKCDPSISECSSTLCKGNTNTKPPIPDDECACEIRSCNDFGCREKGGRCVKNCKCVQDVCTCVEGLCRPNTVNGASLNVKCSCKIPAIVYEGNCCSSGCEKQNGKCVTNCDCSDGTCTCLKDLCNFYPWGGPGVDVKLNPCSCKVPKKTWLGWLLDFFFGWLN